MRTYIGITLTLLLLFFYIGKLLLNDPAPDFGDVENWSPETDGTLADSILLREAFGGEEPALGIVAGRDRQGRWVTEVGACDAGETYRFEADFYRQDRNDSWAYPTVSFWGQSHRLNTHRMYGKYQRLFVESQCPEDAGKGRSQFAFINNYPENSFWMKNPSLVKIDEAEDAPHILPDLQFYPLGVYGASSENLEQIYKSGLNTAVVPLTKANVQACLDFGMRCTLSVPRDPAKLTAKLAELEDLLERGEFSFYVNDEPGIHSFPREKSEQIHRLIKERFPKSFTNMAIVRPQVVSEYDRSADYFMLDQYPVPNMPMVWLAESMDEAAKQVGSDRLQSVIQAFGGSVHAASGWDSFPTFAEMNCLAYLSVIHGSRGIYFFTWPQIAASEKRKEAFGRVINRLNSMSSWLEQINLAEPVGVTMTSRYKLDPSGNPAVHCALKEQQGSQLLVCVNTLRTYVEAEISVSPGRAGVWRDYFGEEPYYVKDDNVLLRFNPLEVKVLLEGD